MFNECAIKGCSKKTYSNRMLHLGNDVMAAVPLCKEHYEE